MTVFAGLSPEFEPAASEYDRARLGALFEEMAGRLDGLAGDDTGTGEVEVGEAPGWTDWVPEPAALPGFAGSRGFWQYDVGSVVEAEDLQAKAALEDPMANPFFGGLLGQTTWEELRALGLGEAVLGAAADRSATDPSEVPAETGVLVGNVQLYLGSFDTERLDAAVEEDVVTESDRPGIFVHTEAEFAFAYDAGYVVGAQTVDEVAVALETAAGERTRWYEAEPEVERLYEAGARVDYTLVNHFSDDTVQETGGGIDLTPFLSANGVAQSASTEGTTFTDAMTALVYPAEDAVEIAALEETLALEAADRTVAQDGRFVQVRATYAE